VRLALTLVLVAGCDWSLQRMQEQPRCELNGTFAEQPCNMLPPDGVVAAEPPFTPPPVTRAYVERGRDRFERLCAPSHGVEADGNSYIARAMTLRRPPSLVDAAARSLPDQRIIEVIEHGYGLMPSYASALPPRDRFAILHFVRAMQQRDVPFDQLPPAQQKEARPWLQP
jgi:hypothetical protein